MNKAELINSLICQRRYKRYLEISMHAEQQNFTQIHCHKKVHIAGDSASHADNEYETFFKHNADKFDLIFIDGIHTEAQVLNDIDNAYKRLATGGIIVLHDCMPPDAWHQRELHEFREGENWNGTAWKAALRLFNQTTHRCSLVDTDWGCGVIDTAGSQSPVNRILPEVLSYELHYKWLLEYKISVAAFVRHQVKVFYHLACMGNWQQVFAEQLQQLCKNGFRQMNMTVLGGNEELRTIRLVAAKCKMDISILFSETTLTYFEKPALLAIEKYARENEGYVLYLHSKGVSNPGDQAKAKWRQLMMRELVQKWEHCVLQLPHYDIIGVNWRDMPPVSHFCGNFWYASTRYLRTLADFNYYYQNPRFQIWDAVNHKRLGCEFWIGSANRRPNLLSLFCRNVDFCNPEYWRNNYGAAFEQRLAFQ